MACLCCHSIFFSELFREEFLQKNTKIYLAYCVLKTFFCAQSIFQKFIGEMILSIQVKEISWHNWV